MAQRLGVNNGDVLRDAAIAGLGLVVLPTFVVGDAIAAGALLWCSAITNSSIRPSTPSGRRTGNSRPKSGPWWTS